MNQSGLKVRLLIPALLAMLAGCGAVPTENVVTGPDGEALRVDAITTILSSTNLSDAQKRQGLRDLGLTDELLIDALIRSAS